MKQGQMGQLVVKVATVALVAFGLSFIGGCGGGGGGGGIPGFTQGGSPYTPPEDVMSKKMQFREVAMEAVFQAPPDLVMSPIEINDLADPEALVGSVELGSVMSLFWHLGITRSRYATNNRVATPKEFITRLTKAWLRAKNSRLTRRTQEKIDWTDPEYGIHWTGTYTYTEETLSLQATGESEGTKISINISGKMTESEASLSMRMEGTTPERIWWGGDWGIARIWLEFSFSGKRTSGNGSLRLGVEKSTLQKVVVEKRVESGSLSYSVSSGDQIQMTFNDEATYSWQVGEGLFWVHTKTNLTLKGLLEEEEWDTVVGTVTADASNGMKGKVEFKEDGTVTGWVKATDGKEAKVTGNIKTEVKLIYPDGTEEILF